MALEAFDIAGRVSVITGGGTGIGRATALLFADAGAPVVLASRKAANLEKVAAEVRERGGRALVVPTDVRDPAQCQALIDRALKPDVPLKVLLAALDRLIQLARARQAADPAGETADQRQVF